MEIERNEFDGFFSPDDWGFSPSINEACLFLAERDLVNTVSISVTRGHWHHRLEELKNLKCQKKVRLALHLDLSYHGCQVARADWWFSKKAARHELTRQLSILTKGGLEIDSLNGHRHVHLYPAVLMAASELGLPLRLPADPAHPNSFYSALLLRWVWWVRWEKVGYLKPEDLENLASLQNKRLRFNSVICHPASQNDFSLIGATDPLKQERVDEFYSLRKLLTF